MEVDVVVEKAMMLVLMLVWTAMERLFGIAAPVVVFTGVGGFGDEDSGEASSLLIKKCC